MFSRKPLFGYMGLVGATIAIAGLSMTVWAHHMFPTGAVLLPFFSFMTFLIAVPTGVKFFNWIGTMWRGQLTFETPMLFAIGFLVTFLLGGLTGVILASPPHGLPRHRLATSWWPTSTTWCSAPWCSRCSPASTSGGRSSPAGCSTRRLGKIHFWTLFIGFHGTFLVQHWLGVEGMPRRYADYLPSDGFTTLNQISSVGAFLLGASTLPFLYNVWRTARNGEQVDGGRPVGLRRLPGVGDLLPAAAAQLHVAAADPLRAARLRPAPRPPAASHAGTPGGPAGTSPAERRRPGTVLT